MYKNDPLQYPPPEIEYTTTFDGKNTTLCKQAKKSFCNKPIGQLLNSEKNIIVNDDILTRSYLITCNFDPNETKDKDHAWKIIEKERTNLVNSLLFHYATTVQLIVSTIEIHKSTKKKGEIKVKKEKNKEKEEKEEEEEEEEEDTIEEKVPVSLHDYPHLHISLYLNSEEMKFPLKEDVQKFLFQSTTFHDILVTRAKRKLETFTSVKYCLKNDRHLEVHNKLKHYPVQIHVISTKYIELFKKITTTKKHRAIMADVNIIVSRYKYDEVINTPLLIIFKIRQYMTKHNLALCNEIVYVKIKDLKMTYRPFCTIEQLVNKIVHNNKALCAPGLSMVTKIERDIIFYLSNKKTFENTEDFIDDDSPDYHNLPYIEININYVWIEFSDCFYNASLRLIVKDQKENYCFAYNKQLNLDNIKTAISNIKKSCFYQILDNSFSTQNLLKVSSYLYDTLVLPKYQKKEVLYFYGDSNSGKTTIVEPFKQLYPSETCKNIKNPITKFDLGGGFENVSLIHGDEFEIFDQKGDIGDFLMLTSGETMKTEEKFKQAKTSSVNVRSLFSSNIAQKGYIAKIENSNNTLRGVKNRKITEEDLQELEIEPKYNIFNRIQPFRFKRLNNVSNVLNVIKSESAVVVMFAGMCYEQMLKDKENNVYEDEESSDDSSSNSERIIKSNIPMTLPSIVENTEDIRFQLIEKEFKSYYVDIFSNNVNHCKINHLLT